MTTIAVTRNSRKPLRADTGAAVTAMTEKEKAEQEAEGGGNAKLTDILVETVPTGLVTAYTAFIAIVSQIVADPTPEVPKPEQFLGLRWIGFVALVLLALFITYGSYVKKAGTGARIPVPELLSVGVAAAGWGLALPESPLVVWMDGTAGLIATALVAFIAVGINLGLANFMMKEKLT
jgi:hypothetical protein